MEANSEQNEARRQYRRGWYQRWKAGMVTAIRPARSSDSRKKTPERTAWADMKHRCLSPTNRQFKDYGGRGITVCDRWLNSFDNFLADMGPRPEQGSVKYSLERENVDGNYEPENCVWATTKQQARNRRSNRPVNYGGKNWILYDLCQHLGLGYATVASRLRNGYPLERAVDPRPLRKHERALRVGGKFRPDWRAVQRVRLQITQEPK